MCLWHVISRGCISCVVSCRVVGKCNFYLSTLFILPFPRHKISLSTIIFHRCEFILFPQTLLLLSFCCPVHVLLGEHICRLNGLPVQYWVGWWLLIMWVGTGGGSYRIGSHVRTIPPLVCVY